MDDMKSLLEALSAGFDDEDFLLLTLQGMIASEVSMKRQALGLTQKQFAELAGVSQSLVSRWESGDTNYTVSTLAKIAAVLKMDMQCPFVPAPATAYADGSNNIIKLPSGSWSYAGSHTDDDFYSVDLEEM